jgi:hypothetical protein
MINNAISWHYRSRTAGEQSDNDLQLITAEFERQIQEWYEALPTPMKFQREPDIPTGNILRCILRCHMTDIREIVRSPAIHSLMSGEPVSPTTRSLAEELLQNALNRLLENRETYYHRHQGTWLMLRSCMKSALQLLGVALACQAEGKANFLPVNAMQADLLPSGWEEAVSGIFQALDYWADESQDMTRLRDICRELLQAYENMKQNR